MHQPDRQIQRQRFFGRRTRHCVGVGNQAHHEGVGRVREIHRGRGILVFNPDAARRAHGRSLHRVGGRRKSRIEGRIRLPQHRQLGADRDELLVVRPDRVARCALALLNDRGERRQRSLGADHRPGPVQADLGGRELQGRIPAERLRLPGVGHEARQTLAEHLVERADRVVVYAHGRQARDARATPEKKIGSKTLAIRLG